MSPSGISPLLTACQRSAARAGQATLSRRLLSSSIPISRRQAQSPRTTIIASRPTIAYHSRHKSESSHTSNINTPESIPSKTYSFSDINDLTASPSPSRILIDVREPAELQSSGHIPGAKNLPINSSPDGLFLPAEDFEEKFGWEKPKASDELVFYCKAGVRSRAAAGIAKMAGWKSIGEYPGSWMDWVEKGGKIER